MLTNYFSDYFENVSNLNTNWSYSYPAPVNFGKVVILSGFNGNSFISDDVDITYMKNIPSTAITTETDEYGNTNITEVAEFGATEFEGMVGAVALTTTNFLDPTVKCSTGWSTVSGDAGEGNLITGSYTGTLFDINPDEKYFLTYNIMYSNYLHILTINKYYHDFNRISLNNTPSLSFLLESSQYVITGFEEIYDPSTGSWVYTKSLNTNHSGVFSVVGDNEYIFYFINLKYKVLNTIIIDKSDFSNIELHKMILPNEVDFINEDLTLNGDFNGIYYKGKIGMVLHVTTSEEEEDPSGNYMCLINPADSTDIRRIETSNVDNINLSNSTIPYSAGVYLVNSGFGYYIGRYITIKNNKAYIKSEDRYLAAVKDSANPFFYKNYIIKLYNKTSNGVTGMAMRTYSNIYRLTAIKNLDIPYIKANNKPVKYTFRIKG